MLTRMIQLKKRQCSTISIHRDLSKFVFGFLVCDKIPISNRYSAIQPTAESYLIFRRNRCMGTYSKQPQSHVNLDLFFLIFRPVLAANETARKTERVSCFAKVLTAHRTAHKRRARFVNPGTFECRRFVKKPGFSQKGQLILCMNSYVRPNHSEDTVCFSWTQTK